MHEHLMADQLGLLTHEQALLAGLSDRRIHGYLARGEWERLFRGVYRHAATPMTDDQRLLAVVQACGAGAAASHRSAAVRIGTRVIGTRMFEVSVASPARPHPRGAVVHRLADLRPEEVSVIDAVPTTTPERTLVDLGMVVSRPVVARMMEEWLADRVVSVASVRQAIDRHAGRGRRGVGVARRVLENRSLGDEAGDSTDEHLVATVLAAYGCPPAVHHHLVRRAGRVVAEVDFAYVPEKVGIELVGYHPHSRSRRAFEAFLDRQNLLQAEGWLLLGFTPAMIRRRPWAIAREIDEARASRAV